MAKQHSDRANSAADVSKLDLKRLNELAQAKVEAAEVAAAPAVEAALVASAESIFAADVSPVLVAAAGDSAGLLAGTGMTTGTLLAIGAGVLTVGAVAAVAASDGGGDDDGSGGPTPGNPTITVTASPASITEGATAATYTIQTTGFAAGQSISYSISGVASSDVDQPLSGLITLDANGGAKFTVSALNDGIVEGNETLSFATSSGATAGNVVTTTIVDATNQNLPGFILKIGQDAVVGTAGNDTIQAPIVEESGGGTDATLESFDTIDGGAGTDSLIATLDGVDIIPVIKAVENITIRNVSGFGEVDFAAVTGLETLTINASSGEAEFYNLEASGLKTLVLSNNTADIAVFDGETATSLTVTGNSGESFVNDADALLTATFTNNSGESALVDAAVLTTATLSGNTDDTFIGEAAALKTVNISDQTDFVEISGNNVQSIALNFNKFGTTGTKGDTGDLTLSHVGMSIATTAVIASTDSYVYVDDDSLFTTVSVAATGANELGMDSFISITKTLTVTGTGTLEFTNEALTAVTVLNAGGNSGGITATVNNEAAAVTVTGSSAADALTFVNTFAKSSISSGAGADVVDVTAVLGDNNTVSLGDGNDVFDISGAATATTVMGSETSTIAGGAGNDVVALADQLASFKLVDGGTGTDIVNLTTDLTSANAVKGLTGFETLDFSGAVAMSAYDLAAQQVGGATFARVQADQGLASPARAAADGNVGGVVVLTNSTASQTVFYSNAANTAFAAGGLTLTQAATVSTATDVATLNVTFNDTLSALVANDPDGIKDDKAGEAEDITFNAEVTTTGYETLSIVSTLNADANLKAGEKYTLSFGESFTTDATRINISGAADVVGGTLDADKLTRVDATGATGAVSIDVSDANQAVRYDGSSGVDTVVFSAFGDNAFGGAGNDLFAFNEVLVQKDTVIYRGGTGASAQTEVTVTKAGLVDLTVAADFETITGFFGFEDVIQLEQFGFVAAGTNQATVGSLTDADAATDGTQIAAQIANFFQVAGGGNRGAVFVNNVDGDGSAYVFVDTNKDGNYTANTDLVFVLVDTALTATDITFLG